MSTKSVIGVKRKDGKVKYAHCHYDGYPSYMIEKLSTLTEEAINNLVSNGLILEVESEVDKLPSFWATDKEKYFNGRGFNYDKNETFLQTHIISEQDFKEENLPSNYEACWSYLYDIESKKWCYYEHGLLTHSENYKLKQGVFSSVA